MAIQVGGTTVIDNSRVVTATGLTVDTNTLHVDSTNNRVGIGTSSPSDDAHLSKSNSGGDVVMRIQNSAVSSGDTATLRFTVTSNSSFDSAFVGSDRNNALILGANDAERMRIINTGRVGIGTTSPVVGLTVNGGIAARGGAPGSNNTNNNGFCFAGNSGDLDGGMFSSSDGNVEFYTNSVERMRLNEHGNLRIGTNGFAASGNSRVAISSAQYGDWSQRQLTLEDTTATNSAPAIGFHASSNNTAGIIKFWGPNGFFEIRNNDDTGFYGIKASQFSVQSDYRLKENVVPLEGACERLASLPVHRFNFIEDIMGHGEGVTVDGFLAHEVADVVPEAVSGTKDELDSAGNPQYQGVDQSKLVPLLTAALKEAITKIEALETRLDALEA